MRELKRWVVGVTMVMVAGAWFGATGIGAMAAPVAQSQEMVQGAEGTRKEFRQLLEQFPPALGVVLKSDPTLLTNTAYLATYPALAKYLAEHPEVSRSPAYFLEHVETVQYVDYRYGGRRSNEPMTAADQARLQSLDVMRDTMNGFTFFLGFAAAGLTLVWILRYLVEHRRWLRSTRIQSEAHNKLLERFSSSTELAAYMESPAGARFLSAAPLAMESSPSRAPGAPFSRILWSAQAGVVLMAAGIGFLVISRRMEYEVAQMLGAWGTFSIAVGVGFVISGAMSYVISSRMGLLGDRKE